MDKPNIHLVTFEDLLGFPPEYWLTRYGQKWFDDWKKPHGGYDEAVGRLENKRKTLADWLTKHRSHFLIFILNNSQRTEQWNSFLETMKLPPSSIIHSMGPFKNITNYTAAERLNFFVIQVPKYYGQ